MGAGNGSIHCIWHSYHIDQPYFPHIISFTCITSLCDTVLKHNQQAPNQFQPQVQGDFIISCCRIGPSLAQYYRMFIPDPLLLIRLTHRDAISTEVESAVKAKTRSSRWDWIQLICWNSLSRQESVTSLQSTSFTPNSILCNDLYGKRI